MPLAAHEFSCFLPGPSSYGKKTFNAAVWLVFLRRKHRKQFFLTNLKANHGLNNVLEVFSFRCRFPHVDDNRKSKVSAFFPKQNKANTVERSETCVRNLIPVTPFSHLLCYVPNFRSTDRIHRPHCQTVHSTDELCRLSWENRVLLQNHELRSIKTKVVRPSKPRFQEEIISSYIDK